MCPLLAAGTLPNQSHSRAGLVIATAVATRARLVLGANQFRTVIAYSDCLAQWRETAIGLDQSFFLGCSV
jgi:hypothetical protein